MFRCCCQTHRDSDGRITGGGCTKNLKPIAVASENHQNTFTLFHMCWAYCDSNLTMQWSLLKVVGVISRNVKEVHLCGLAYTLIPKKMIIGYSHVWTPMGSVTIYLFILKSCNLLWWFVVLEWLELCMCCPYCEVSTWLVGTCVVNKGLSSNPLCYLLSNDAEGAFGQICSLCGSFPSYLLPTPPPPGGVCRNNCLLVAVLGVSMAILTSTSVNNSTTKKLRMKSSDMMNHLSIMNLSTPVFPPF